MTQSFTLKFNSRRQSMVCSTLLCLLGTRPSFPSPLCLAQFFSKTYQEESTVSSFSSLSSTELGVFFPVGRLFATWQLFILRSSRVLFVAQAGGIFSGSSLNIILYHSFQIIHSFHRKRFLYPLRVYQNICFSGVPLALVGIFLLWASDKTRKIQ